MAEQDVQPTLAPSLLFGGHIAVPDAAGYYWPPGPEAGHGLLGTPPDGSPGAEAGAGMPSELVTPADLLSHWATHGSADSDEHSAESTGGGPTGVPAPVMARAGAQSRENLIQIQSQRAYEAGLHAPRGDYNGTLHRNVPASRWEGYADHRFGDAEGGRYNAPGQRMIYTSPSAAEAQGEMAAYAKPGKPPLADMAHVEMHYNAHVDPHTGQGGVADVSGSLSQLGLQRNALTEARGGRIAPEQRTGLDRILGQIGAGIDRRFGTHLGDSLPRPDHRSWLSHLTGEDPYLHTRALGQGATEAGASAIRVPSATGGEQIDILPGNTDPRQLQYEQHTTHDSAGATLGPAIDPVHANQHVPGGSGRGVMPPGDAPIPTPNRLHPAHPKHFSTADSPGRTERAGAARYGLAGAGLVSGIDNLNEVLHGRKHIGQALTDTAVNTGVGGLSAVASEALARRMGGGVASTGTGLRNGLAAARPGLKAGALVDAVTSGVFSTWDNAAEYRAGRETAGQATANVLVDTGVGVSSGLAGAAAGAALGSVIPVAGTAVGALLGFGAGLAGSWLANKAISKSGIADYAKTKLGGAFNRFNQPLSKAWDGVSQATGAISAAPGRAWSGAKQLANGASHSVGETAGRAWSGAKSLAAGTGQAIGNTAGKAWGALKSLW